MVMMFSGLALFLGMHSTAIVGLRDPAVDKLGEGVWKGLYSLVSIVGIVLIGLGYAQARANPVFVYFPPVWARHLVLLLMVPVFPMLFAAYLPGRIQRTLKHPMLVATKLWALVHLMANGTACDLGLFGGILAWAVIDRISLGRRATVREIAHAPEGPFNDAIAVVGGLVTYGVFLMWGHAWLIGVSPL